MKSYTETDQYLHWLCQTISEVNRSFVAVKADDSHSNLYFDWLGNRIVGRWIETENRRVIFSLNLSTLSFEWLNSSYQSISSFSTIGKTIDALEREIEKHLPELDLNPKVFTDKLHYDRPSYPFTNDEIKKISVPNLNEWKYYRNLANKVCAVLLGHLQVEGEIRIWPHHFDTGLYVITNDGMGIGFGLAMSDTIVGVPYFYMSGYPQEDSLDFNDLPSFLMGKWETGKHWQGAILPISELKSLPKRDYITVINDYLIKSLRWFLTS